MLIATWPVLAGLRGAALAALVLAGAPAAANEFVVDTTADTLDAVAGDGVCRTSDGACSLRAALTEAGKTRGVVVRLPAGRYVVGAPLILPAATALTGEGPAATVIAPGGAFDNRRQRARLIHIEGEGAGGPARIEALTLDGARRVGGVAVGRGAALAMRAVVVRDSRSRDDGPGLRVEGPLRATAVSVLDNKIEGRRGRGGGIHIERAPAWLTDVTVTGNDAPAGGGIFVRGGALYGERLHVVGNVGGAGVQTNPGGRIELRDSWLGGTTTPSGKRRPDCLDNGGDRSSETPDSFVSLGGNRIEFRGQVREMPRGAKPGGSSGGPAQEGGDVARDAGDDMSTGAGDRRCGPAGAGDQFDLDAAIDTPTAPVRTTDDAGIVRIVRSDPIAGRPAVAVSVPAAGGRPAWGYFGLAALAAVVVAGLYLVRRRKQ